MGRRSTCRECVRKRDAELIASGEKASRMRQLRKAYPERYAAYTRNSQLRHRDRRNKRANERHRELLASSPEYRLRKRLSLQLYAMLRGTKARRKTVDLLGYSTAELKAHIERQFLPGMGWHNTDEWHLDHIVPLSSFAITGPDDPELRVAWGLPNLRPLWAKDNLRKSDKREYLV